MQTRGSWARWALLANGLLVALLGAAFLFAEFVLPHIVVAAERAQGIELYAPRVGGDPLLAQPHAWIRPMIAALFVVTGTAHVLTGVFRRRLSDGVLVPLTAFGMMSFVPTSIVLGLVTLAALLREGERGA